MNRTDRLLAIILELQAKGVQRAEDLAATFEVHKRSIYRDIQALLESGVPIISEPGKGYTIMEGYFLPPVRFSPDEAIILLLGCDVMAQNFDDQYRAAAQSAASKISAVIPPPLRDDVTSLQQSIRFIEFGTVLSEVLIQIRRAVLAHQTVCFDYQAKTSSDPSPTQREVDPYGLVHWHKNWYMMGFDHARRDTRIFRLERIEHLVITQHRFVRPAHFNLGERPEDDPPRNVTVRLLFSPEIARWAKEERPFFWVSDTEAPDGLVMELLVRQTQDVLQWVLGWGSRVRVLEPESLRQMVMEEARRVWENYS